MFGASMKSQTGDKSRCLKATKKKQPQYSLSGSPDCYSEGARKSGAIEASLSGALCPLRNYRRAFYLPRVGEAR